MNRIKELRLAHGMKQSELAAKVGVSQAALSGYESGEHEPGKSILVKIAAILNTTTDYLLGHSNMKKAPSLEDAGLSFEELKVLTLFRAAPKNLQDAALRMLEIDLTKENK